MTICPFYDSDREQLILLIADFWVMLAEFKGLKRPPDLERARQELDDYLIENFPIFVAVDSDQNLLGYLVCRVANDVVWAESLYVHPERRQQGIDSVLYAEAERLAAKYNSDTVHNRTHPHNDKITTFYRRKAIIC